jgi:hypothetical protein
MKEIAPSSGGFQPPRGFPHEFIKGASGGRMPPLRQIKHWQPLDEGWEKEV